MAEMMEATMDVRLSFKRDKPHPLFGKETKMGFEGVGVLLLPESSPSEDYSEQDIIKMVQDQHSDTLGVMHEAGWTVAKAEVLDYDVTGHDEY